MKYCIVEERYYDKSVFYPEWFCNNKIAVNYGWNSIYDSNIMLIPENTYENAVDRIQMFDKMIKEGKKYRIIHDIEI